MEHHHFVIVPFRIFRKAISDMRLPEGKGCVILFAIKAEKKRVVSGKRSERSVVAESALRDNGSEVHFGAAF